jgi:hypothetical protein
MMVRKNELHDDYIDYFTRCGFVVEPRGQRPAFYTVRCAARWACGLTTSVLPTI